MVFAVILEDSMDKTFLTTILMCKKIYFIFLLTVTLISQSCIINKCGRTEQEAKEYIETHIKNTDTLSTNDKLISKRKVLRIAKWNIYKTYGFWHIILNEKPYKKYYIDRYLYLGGTLRKGWKGGVFWIVVDRKNGEIKSMCHSK